MKRILSVLLTVLMMFVFAVPAFAAEEGDDSSPQVLRIPEGTKVVTSSTVDDGVIDRLRVRTIYIPSSVTTIRAGALTGYANVTNVYIENSKDNITIENGAFATGANIVYTEKPTTPPPSSTTTTTKAEESTTKKDDTEDKSTTKKTDADDKSTTKKTTKKTTAKTATTKKTSSRPATTSDPKKRTTVQHRTVTVPGTKARKTTVKGPLIPEVEVDPEDIEEQPDPSMEEEITTITFSGEAITDKDGTIIGFEDPQPGRANREGGSTAARIGTIAGVGVVGVSAIAFLAMKFRRRP